MTEQLLKEILGELKGVRSELTTLNERVGNLENRQLRLETRIESEITEKIGALFDGFSLRGDQIENLQKHLDERLDSIELDTGYLVSRVARLEKAAK